MATLATARAGHNDQTRVLDLAFALGRPVLPISNLVALATQLQTARANLAQVQDVLDYEIDPHLEGIAEPARAADANGSAEKAPHKLEGFVELRDVTFGYGRHQPPLLEEFSAAVLADDANHVAGRYAKR